METITTRPDTRLILALMTFAVAFALAGKELEPSTTTQSEVGTPAVTIPGASGGVGGARIILGGFAAATLLTLLSHAGEPGRQFAVGLAVLTCVSSMLVYGQPVWAAISKLSAAGPGGTPSASTTPTTPTTPTQGTVATSVALAQAA